MAPEEIVGAIDGLLPDGLGEPALEDAQAGASFRSQLCIVSPRTTAAMKTVGRRSDSGVPGNHRHTGDSLLFVAGEKRRHDEPGLKEGDREGDRVRGKALLLDLERRLRSRWRKRSLGQEIRKVE